MTQNPTPAQLAEAYADESAMGVREDCITDFLAGYAAAAARLALVEECLEIALKELKRECWCPGMVEGVQVTCDPCDRIKEIESKLKGDV